MEKIYTIKDIAEMAGVSKGTVDRVIHKRGKVSQKAHDKVTRILKDINYQPNLLARNLKNNRIINVCILIPDPKLDDYWTPCVAGVNDVKTELNAFGVNISTYYFDPKSAKSFKKASLSVLDSNPDAVLVAPLFKKQSLQMLDSYVSQGIITSFFNNHINSSLCKNFVGQDLHQSGRVAAKLLHDLLKKDSDIAIIHIDENYKNAIYVQEKEKGFRNYFDEQKQFNQNIFTVKLKHPDFETDLISFFDKNPQVNGIFVTTSKAYQIAPIIAKMGKADLAFVGYDLLDENIAFLNKGTINFLIHQNPKQQAYIGLKLLAEHLLFDKTIPHEVLLHIDIINSENVAPFMRP